MVFPSSAESSYGVTATVHAPRSPTKAGPFGLAHQHAELAIQPIIANEDRPKHQRHRRKSLSFLLCCCGGSFQADNDSTLASSSCNDSKQQPLIGAGYAASPRKVGARLIANRSNCYSSADWHDAVSQFSGSIDQYQDHAAIEELTQVVKELGMFTAPWIPDQPLVFGTPGMQFMPVPAVTGIAGYWMKDDKPFLGVIDDLLKASALTRKIHQSIPGILVQETGTELTILARPGFIPALIKFDGYLETYSKTDAAETNWTPRLDLNLGKAHGKLYMTTDGTMVAHVEMRTAFSGKVDVILEHYVKAEPDGDTVVATFNCLHVASGKRTFQRIVAHRGTPPPAYC